jgi:hypothetical protein
MPKGKNIHLPIGQCEVCRWRMIMGRSWRKYCSKACYEKSRLERNRIIVKPRPCAQCRNIFTPSALAKNRNIIILCSDICRGEYRRAYAKRWNKNNPEARDSYYKKAAAKFGVDKPLKRLWRVFPDMPRYCEGCGDDRVLDIAHKPYAKRNGARRTRKNTNPDTVWILCPTCHALLDRKGWSPTEVGIKRS